LGRRIARDEMVVSVAGIGEKTGDGSNESIKSLRINPMRLRTNPKRTQ